MTEHQRSNGLPSEEMPVTKAGPEFARLVQAFAKPPFHEGATYQVFLQVDGSMLVVWSANGEIIEDVPLSADDVSAINLRGLLRGVTAGVIR